MDNLFIATLVFPEDDILAWLFLFQSGVVTTLEGLVLGIIGDEDGVLLLLPLVDGDEGSLVISRLPYPLLVHHLLVHAGGQPLEPGLHPVHGHVLLDHPALPSTLGSHQDV